MSTNPETRAAARRADDRIVTLLSHWLTRTLGNDDLRVQVEAIGTEELAPGQAEAVGELIEELGASSEGARGDLEMVVRETLEALAYGD